MEGSGKKSKLWVVWAIILLLIPTYIAIYALVRTSHSPIAPEKAKALVITDLTGRVYEKEPTDRVAQLFAGIGERAVPTDAPDALTGAPAFTVSYRTDSRTNDYQYYFSKNTDTVYYKDSGTGQWYHVAEADASAFLLTDCAQCLFDEAAVPALTLGGSTVAPTGYNWAYLGADGATTLAGSFTEKAEADLAYKAGTLELLYGRAPDTFNVTVKDPDGNPLYTGAYTEIGSAVDFGKYKTLSVEAAASWLADETHPSGGSADYRFVLEVTAPPAFRLNNSLSDAAQKGDGTFTAQPGDLLTVTASGIDSADKITFTSEPALTHDGKEIVPVFFAGDGRAAYAYLPTAYDTAPGTYTLTFGYAGATVLTATLEIEKTRFASQPYTVSKAVAEATRTAQTLAAYQKVIDGVLAADHGTCYLDGKAFVCGANLSDGGDGVKYVTGYGKTRTVTATGESYVPGGVEFELKEGSDVYAMGPGKVVYADNTAFSGKMVIVDHGYGLISRYQGLSEFGVQVGDTLATGDLLGKSGSTGFNKGNSLYVAITVYDVPVCPYNIWDIPTPITFD